MTNKNDYSGMSHDALVAIINTLDNNLRDMREVIVQQAFVNAKQAEHIRNLRNSVQRAGLVLKGWWCNCGVFNGEEKEDRSHCRSCDTAKPVMPYPPLPSNTSIAPASNTSIAPVSAVRPGRVSTEPWTDRQDPET